MGMLDSKGLDQPISDMALRMLGALAAVPGFPAQKKDAVIEELTKRSQGGFSTPDSTFQAAVDGLVRAKDPRAVEPLRKLS